MTTTPGPLPPPLPKGKNKRKVLLIAGLVVGAILILGFGAYLAIKGIVDSGITQGPDAMFGDQHLKTAVALVELHKVRTGRYPETLGKLQFTGQWDKLALQSVRYVVSADGASYYIEVERGWVGKPKLQMPAEFWRGTGYNPSLAETPP